MISVKHTYILMCISLFPFLQNVSAQESYQLGDSIYISLLLADDYKLTYRKLLIPSTLVAIGSISFAVPAMKKFDKNTRNEVYIHQPSKTKLDSYVQFFPGAIVYGLNFSGINGKHNFKDRSIIYATSQLLVSAIVLPSKSLIGEERPDGSDNRSFPSGHAAIAFSNAHFMYREYRDDNVGLSLSGYPFAIFTGIYRVINNRHWVTDVVAGAGVGILSTELSYWIFPKLNSILSRKKGTDISVVPFYQQRSIGFSFVKLF